MPAGRPPCRRGLPLCHGGRRRLRQGLPSEARLECRHEVGRGRPGFDLDALDLLPRDFLLDRFPVINDRANPRAIRAKLLAARGNVAVIVGQPGTALTVRGSSASSARVGLGPSRPARRGPVVQRKPHGSRQTEHPLTGGQSMCIHQTRWRRYRPSESPSCRPACPLSARGEGFGRHPEPSRGSTRPHSRRSI
jgi:hypothetical protein